MKRAVMTALAVTLLTGTSALAQGGPLSRVVREAQGDTQAQSQRQSQRAAPPQRQSPAPQQAQSRGDGARRGGEGGNRGGGGQAPLAGAAPQTQQQAQRRQSGWQSQRRPDGQGVQGQGRPSGQQGQRGGADRQGAGGRENSPDGRSGYDRRDEGGPLARTVREAVRDRENGRPGWNNNDRDRDWDRRPVIRPEDRRDRDRNRPRYDERRYPRYVTPYQRYRWVGPSYRLPPGFYSFRWQWGQTLPWSWYTPDYYLNDYWRYGLPMPPIGCEWIRAGDDAILVDVFNGRVYQVVYNLFW